MCSTARVVSAGLRTDDEPSPADDNEEGLSTSHPGTRTPRTASVRDPGWDEDEPVLPKYPSVRLPVHIPHESHRAVQAPNSRGHAGADERSPLLSRVAEGGLSQPTAPRRPSNSVPAKPSPIGQSTFSQTVSSRVCLFSQVRSV
jgi:hypothetical protein